MDLFKTERENINKSKTDYNLKTNSAVSQTKCFVQPKTIVLGWWFLLKKVVIISILGQPK